MRWCLYFSYLQLFLDELLQRNLIKCSQAGLENSKKKFKSLNCHQVPTVHRNKLLSLWCKKSTEEKTFCQSEPPSDIFSSNETLKMLYKIKSYFPPCYLLKYIFMIPKDSNCQDRYLINFRTEVLFCLFWECQYLILPLVFGKLHGISLLFIFHQTNADVF